MTRDQIITRALSTGRLDPRKLDWAQVAPIGRVLAEICAHEPGAFNGISHLSKDVARLSNHDPDTFEHIAHRPIRYDATTDEGQASLAQIAERGGHSVAALRRNAARLDAEEEKNGGPTVPSFESDDDVPPLDAEDNGLTDTEVKICKKLNISEREYAAAKAAATGGE